MNVPNLVSFKKSVGSVRSIHVSLSRSLSFPAFESRLSANRTRIFPGLKEVWPKSIVDAPCQRPFRVVITSCGWLFPAFMTH